MSHRIATILAVALVARVGLFLAAQPWDPDTQRSVVLQADASDYHRLASTLVREGRYALDPDSPPSAIRSPGYPAFVAAFYSVAGERPWAVMIGQILLDVVTCALVAAFAARVAGARAAPWAAGFYAVDPVPILSCSSLLSDTLFVFLVLSAVWIATSPPPAVRGAAAAAFLLGIATLVRPIGQFVPLALVPYWLFVMPRRRALLASLTAAGAFLLVVVPWALRNEKEFGEFALSPSGTYLLALYTVPAVAAQTGRPVAEVKQDLAAEVDATIVADGADPEAVGDFQLAAYQRRVAMEHIRADLLGFAKSYAWGVGQTFTNLATFGYTRLLGLRSERLDIKSDPGVISSLRRFVAVKGVAGLVIGGAIALFLAVTYACGIVGAIARHREFARPLGLLCVAIAAILALVCGPGGLARYKLPIIPFYEPFVAAGAVWLAGRRLGRRRTAT